MQIGQTIRNLRLQRGLTQEALARELHVTAQAVSRWENGTAMPDISLLVPLANYFDITVDELLAWDAEGTEAAVRRIQQEFYQQMDKDPAAAEQVVRAGLRQYPGNEKLLVNLLYLLRREECREERIALCWRLLRQGSVAVRFEALRVLAKTCVSRGDRALAKELLEQLPELERTKLEVQALLLDGEDSLQAAQREKTASLARLVDMLRVIAAHQKENGQGDQAVMTIGIAQNVIEAFQPDQPYQFPLAEGPQQTYKSFQTELKQLAALRVQYERA